MKLPRFHLPICLLALLCGALSLPQAAQAQRRDFAATYRVSNITEETDKVTLTLSLTIHNSSGADIRYGGVALYSSLGPRSRPVDAFDVIKLFPNHKEATLSRQFTIPKGEYERWARGENPNLQFFLPDGNGGTRVVPIDLSRVIDHAAPSE